MGSLSLHLLRNPLANAATVLAVPVVDAPSLRPCLSVVLDVLVAGVVGLEMYECQPLPFTE